MGIKHPHKPSDYPSFTLYILDETHLTVTVATALVVLYTRNIHVAYFSIGAVASSLFAKQVKRIVRQPRPSTPSCGSKASPPVRPKQTYGMPSTHSTVMSFYMFYLFPLLPLLTYNGNLSVRATEWVERIALTAVWSSVLWSRVELGYHTWSQVGAGAALGAISAGIWTGIWKMNPWIQHVGQNVIDQFWATLVRRIWG